MPGPRVPLVKVVFEFLQSAHKSHLADLYCIYVLFAFSLSLNFDAEANDITSQQGLNTLSIAEITGIPRETVRRKLKVLLDKNLIVRGPKRPIC